MQLRNAEINTLKSALEGCKSAEVESIIHGVLKQRHLRETVQLAAQHEKEKAMAVEERKTALKNRRQEERDRIVAEQEKAIIELISKSASLTKPQLAKQKLELKKEQKKLLAEFDRETQDMLEDAGKEVVPEIDVCYNEQLLAMRERHIRELATAMEQLSPEEALAQSYMEEAERAASEAERYRREVVEARDRKIAQLKEERRKKAEMRHKEQEQRLHELEAEIEREKQRDAQREQKMKERYEAIQKQRLEEQETMHQKSLQTMGNVPEEEREVSVLLVSTT